MESELYELMEYALLGLISSSDIDYAMECYLLMSERKPKRLRRTKREFNLDTMKDERVLANFRFKKEDLPRLQMALGIPESLNVGNRIKVNGLTALCILTRRLAHPNRLIDLEDLFGYSVSVISLVFNSVVSLIKERHGHRLNNLQSLKWLNDAKLKEYCSAIVRKGSPLKICWGFIDSTARRICRPTKNDKLYWNDDKKFHCVKYQSILAPDGLIVSLRGAYPGSYDNEDIFEESSMYDQLKKLGSSKVVLYANSTYEISDVVITPYTEEKLSPKETIFNSSMNKVYRAVEWGFDKIISEFAFCNFYQNQKLLLQGVSSMYKVSTLLTNCHTCLYGSPTSTYFDIKPPKLEEYLL